MGANFNINAANNLLNLKAEQVFINDTHTYKTQAAVPIHVPQTSVTSVGKYKQYKHINTKARHSVL